MHIHLAAVTWPPSRATMSVPNIDVDSRKEKGINALTNYPISRPHKSRWKMNSDSHDKGMGLKRPATEKELMRIRADIETMRKAINDSRLDSILIRQCFQFAEDNGLSGEEAFLMLAYQALIRLEETAWVRLTALDPKLPLLKCDYR
jgi:hypothetical protein